MLEIIAPEIEVRCIHGVHINVGDAELADLGAEPCEQALGRIDGGHAAGRTNRLRCGQCQCPGASGYIQNFVAGCGAQVCHKSIGAEDRETQCLAIGAFAHGISQ